jgi:hypothetical protein
MNDATRKVAGSLWDRATNWGARLIVILFLAVVLMFFSNWAFDLLVQNYVGYCATVDASSTGHLCLMTMG